MPRHRRRNKATKPPPGPLDPIHQLLEQYLTWMQTQNFSEDTVTTRRTMVCYFLDWSKERGIDNPADITRPILERYQRALYQHRKVNGQALTFRTQVNRLRAIRGFFRWLARKNHILHNPASELELPRLDSRLPKYVLTANEAEQVIAQPDVNDAEGLRDRAMLETFYSTGMRRMELANLKIFDVDEDRGTILIRQGKGKKDRYVPAGERTLAWIAKYTSDARPKLFTSGSDDGTLFLTHLGTPFERQQLTRLVRRYLEQSKIGKVGGCHLWRHTAATLMLENGADVRVIQEMLGHSQLSTTELYTRVSINLLKQVHAATHPAAKLLAILEAERIDDDEEE